MHLKFTYNPENYILKKILSTSVDCSHSPVPSLASGKKYEPVARQQYIKKHKRSHKNCKVDPCSLFVREKYPFMRASPDGRVSCKCCGVGLPGVKCSLTYQISNCKEAC